MREKPISKKDSKIFEPATRHHVSWWESAEFNADKYLPYHRIKVKDDIGHYIHSIKYFGK